LVASERAFGQSCFCAPGKVPFYEWARQPKPFDVMLKGILPASSSSSGCSGCTSSIKTTCCRVCCARDVTVYIGNYWSVIYSWTIC